MWHLIFKAIFISLIALFNCSALAASQCEYDLMNAYLANRAALLDPGFSSKKVLDTLWPNFKERIQGNLKLYLVALRIQEAKIIKLYEFAGKCNSEGGELRLKVLYKEGEYNRLFITIKKYNNKNYLYSSSVQVSSEENDKLYKYEVVEINSSPMVTIKIK